MLDATYNETWFLHVLNQMCYQKFCTESEEAPVADVYFIWCVKRKLILVAPVRGTPIVGLRTDALGRQYRDNSQQREGIRVAVRS
jgi:hypothetical protein